jgi:hypothetical protein
VREKSKTFRNLLTTPRTRLGLTIGLTLLFAASGMAAPILQRGPRNLGGVGRGAGPDRGPGVNPRQPIQDMIEGLYVSRMQQELNLDDDQFVRILPLLRESLQERNQVGQRHNRALNELRQALGASATDEELERLVDLVDESDAALRDIQEELLQEVDPELSTRQRARFRIAQPNLENRIRTLIQQSRNPAPAPQNRRPPQR